VLVWPLAATEVISALARKRREGSLSPARFATAKKRLSDLAKAWNEVHSLDTVQARARRLLEIHPLTAADSLHLAAALVAVEERTAGFEFLTFDQRLREAALREGFEMLPKTKAE